MINNIINYINQNKFLLFGVALLLLIVLFVSTSSKKRKFALLSFLLTVFCVLVFALNYFKVLKMPLFGYDLILYAFGLIVLTLIINFIIFLYANCIYNRKVKIIIASTNQDKSIYGFLDSNSKLLFFTDHFYNHFNLDKKGFEKQLSNIVIEEKNYNLKKFNKMLISSFEKDYHLDVTISNNENSTDNFGLDLCKRKIIINSNLIGYVLTNNNFTNKMAQEAKIINKTDLDVYLDLIDSAIASYDNALKEFFVNKEMMRLLASSDNRISENKFSSLIVREDAKFYMLNNTSLDDQKNIFRVKTINGNLWFEEAQVVLEGKKYYAVRHTSFSKYKNDYSSYQNLIESIRMALSTDANLVLFKISISDFPKFVEKIGLDAAMVVVSQYFNSLANEFGLAKMKVYRGSEDNYYIIMNKNEKYEKILSELNNKSSLLSMSLSFNEIHMEMKNYLAVVDREQVSTTNAEDILKAADESLLLASDDRYPNNYVIYTPQKEATGYDFRDVGIDLSDDFLDDILK
jgi:hypothetical protein